MNEPPPSPTPDRSPAEPPPEERSPYFAVWAGVFEGGLAVAAVVLGRWMQQPPLASFAWSPAALGWGLLATLPMLGLLGLAIVLPWRPLRELADLVERQLAPLFRGVGLPEIAIICFLAGLGEEMLFRGVVQAVVTADVGGHNGPWVGWLAASLLFAMGHPISRMYFFVTLLIGLYLGGIWIISGNLLVPIVAHAVYDFAAMFYYLRLRKNPADTPPADEPPDRG